MKTQNKIQNPWKGLQSYQERDIIYGRDKEIQELYTQIFYNTQTVVYGKSGIGKSSIINAGIIPRAKLDYFLPIHIRLAHTNRRQSTPTVPYIDQIKNRIEEEANLQGAKLEAILPHISSHPETLWELLHRHILWVKDGDSYHQVTPLLLFDQFEEIFTLETDNKRVKSFFAELADLLNEIKPDYLNTPASPFTANPPQHQPDKDRPHNIFSQLIGMKREKQPEYIEKSNFRIVIILREDFLPHFERHTTHIPALKGNRFSLLPLNEEQAAEIITRPMKNLVNLNVAELIIQKVTGRTDFTLDGIPEISIEATMLSLYLEQLYERMPENSKEITAELVNNCSDTIIKDFYEQAIQNIPSKSVELLEDELLTNSNRRNNVALDDLKAEGISEEDIDKLIEKKVLCRFNYNEDTRIELIHDKLCPIVAARIENREQFRLQQELLEHERNKQIEITREANKHMRRIIVAAFTLFFIICGIFSYIYINKPVPLVEEQYMDVELTFVPDQTLEGDEWKARIEIDALSDSTFDMSILSKEYKDKENIILKGPGSKTIKVKALAKKIEQDFHIRIQSKKEWLCQDSTILIRLKLDDANGSHSIPVTINLKRNPQATYTLYGKVVTLCHNRKDTEEKAIMDAFVICNNKLARTDANGTFSITIKDTTVLKGSNIYIMKNEYEAVNIKGVDILEAYTEKEKSQSPYTIKLQLRQDYDSLFIQELTSIQDLLHRIKSNESYISRDTLLMERYLGKPSKLAFTTYKETISKDTHINQRKYRFIYPNSNNNKFFGYSFTGIHGEEKVFYGYREKIGEIWHLNIVAHDNIFNQEYIQGFIQHDSLIRE